MIRGKRPGRYRTLQGLCPGLSLSSDTNFAFTLMFNSKTFLLTSALHTGRYTAGGEPVSQHQFRHIHGRWYIQFHTYIMVHWCCPSIGYLSMQFTGEIGCRGERGCRWFNKLTGDIQSFTVQLGKLKGQPSIRFEYGTKRSTPLSGLVHKSRPQCSEEERLLATGKTNQ